MAEDVHVGKMNDSFLFVSHFDHPQMCLDGLVGCLAGHELLNRLRKKHIFERLTRVVMCFQSLV